MEKMYSKEIMKFLDTVAKTLISSESVEIRITKNVRGKVMMSTTETSTIILEN